MTAGSRSRLALLLALALLALPGRAAAQGGTVVPLTNPSFEDGSFNHFNGWGNPSGSTAFMAFDCATYPGRCEDGNWFMNYAPGTVQLGTTYQLVSLTAGNMYTALIYVRLLSGVATHTARIAFDSDPAGTRYAVQDCSSFPLDTYTQCSVSWLATVTGTNRITIEGYGLDIDLAALSYVLPVTPTPTQIPPTPTPTPIAALPTPTAYAPSGGGADAGKVCYVAMQYAVQRISQGLAYCWGSRDPTQYVSDSLCPTGYGLDCSGLGVWAYRQAGYNLPDDTAQGMYNKYVHVLGSLTGAGLAVGDAVVLGNSASSIYHVAWYAGGGIFADCFNTGVGCVTHRIDSISAYTTAPFVGYFRICATVGLPQCSTSDYVSGPPPTGDNGGGGSAGGGGFSNGLLPGLGAMLNPPAAQPQGYSQLEAEKSLLPAELAQADDGWSASLRGSLYDFGCPIDIDKWSVKARLCVQYKYINKFTIMGIDIPLESMIYGCLVLVIVYIVKRR